MKAFRKQLKKAAGGVEKHGLGGAIAKEADKVARSVDGALGSPSHLTSSDTAKRKEAENGLKDVVHVATGGVAYPGRAEAGSSADIEDEVAVDESLKAFVLAYLDENPKTLDLKTVSGIKTIIEVTGDEDIDIAFNIIAFGNTEVNDIVKDWVMDHISAKATIEDLRAIAGTYFTEHSSETDVALAIGTGGDSVTTLAPALFATNHPELSSEVAAYLLGAEVFDPVE